MEICRGNSPTLSPLLESRKIDLWLYSQKPISIAKSPTHIPNTKISETIGCDKELIKVLLPEKTEHKPEKEKCQAHESRKSEGSVEINGELKIEPIQPAETEVTPFNAKLKSQNPRVEARRTKFQDRLNKSEIARAIRKERGEEETISHEEFYIRSCIDNTPTSARSFGTTDFGAGLWRDFAYQWPWPDPPCASPLLNPKGFGKFFSCSPKIPAVPDDWEVFHVQVVGDSTNSFLKTGELQGEINFGDDFYSDPRTANRVDWWLQCYSHPKDPFLTQLFGDPQRKSLMKQIFNDTEDLGLLRDILALIDYKRLLEKNGFRHQSTKSFCKFYRRNGEITLTQFRGQLQYKIDKVLSLDLLNDSARWREVCAAWYAPYSSSEIISLQPLQRDANSLARSYYNIRVKEDPELKFIHIYRAFYQLELYCEMFRLTTCFTPETSGESLEKMKRIFFERYQPAQAELVLKISRWLVREWNCIDQHCEGEIGTAIQESLKIDEVYNANQRQFGVEFFSELLYSSLPIQIALILRNKWQLSLIKFTWLTNCWAAHDVDENGEVLLMIDQGIVMKDDEMYEEKRYFRSFTWKADVGTRRSSTDGIRRLSRG